MAKIQDVAKLANVSVSTVSRAFREDTVVNEETRKLVLEKAREIGYYPNLLARGLKTSENKTVGIIGSIDNPFYVDIIKAIELELMKHGYHLLVGSTMHSAEREQYYLELMAGLRVAGVIMTPFFEEDSAHIDLAFKSGIPVVQLFRKPYKFLDSVLIDDEYGAYIATKTMIKSGHTRILLFDVPVSHACQRSDGYRKAFAENGLSLDENMIVITSDDDIPSVIEKLKPSAVITGVYEQGEKVFRYIKENNLKMPGDISVIMFDNVEWMEKLDIDAIAQPIDYVGLSASRLLIDRLSGASEKPVSLVLQPKYVARSSVGKPR